MTNDHIYWTGVHLGAIDRKGKKGKKSFEQTSQK
jgi:hypothetical protein